MALNKYRRTNFQKLVEVDGILERDLINNNWDLFEIKRPMTFFTVTTSFIQRPELLSLKLYGKMAYWWILAKVNESVQDFWNDISVGDIINVPDVRDIEDWYVLAKRRQRQKK